MEIKKVNQSEAMPVINGMQQDFKNTLWLRQLNANRAEMYFSDDTGYTVRLGGNPNSSIKYVAAKNSNPTDKAFADYICDGVNDHITIQKAVDDLVEGGTVYLMVGIYNLNEFITYPDGLKSCIFFKKSSKENRFVEIKGITKPQVYFGRNTAILNVTQAAYDSVGTEQVAVISGSSQTTHMFAHVASWKISDLIIRTPANQKPIIMIDFRNATTGGTEGVHMYAETVWQNMYGGGTGRPPIPHEGFVGIYGFGVSNSKYYTEFKWTIAQGFHEGFKMGGDHVMLWACATGRCTYGYTFETYTPPGIHPMQLYYCTDETNTNFPLFGDHANGRYINFIDFQIERQHDRTPGAVLGYAKEIRPGVSRGTITWSTQERTGSEQFWEHDGSGIAFQSRNVQHRTFGSSSVRRSYGNCHWGQQFFDTGVGKMLWYNGTDWVDAAGVIVP